MSVTYAAGYDASKTLENITLIPNSTDDGYWLVSVFGKDFHVWPIGDLTARVGNPITSSNTYLGETVNGSTVGLRPLNNTASTGTYRQGVGAIRISADGTKIAYSIA